VTAYLPFSVTNLHQTLNSDFPDPARPRPLARGKVFIDFTDYIEYKELSINDHLSDRWGHAVHAEGAVLTRRLNIFQNAIAMLGILLLCSCVPLEKMDAASGTIEETDYLNSLAGIYEAVFQPVSGDEAIITLRLYPDGSCLFSEKIIGGPASGLLVSTGRWDYSDFSEGVTLRLKTRNGARRIMQCRQDTATGNLVYSGQGYGPDGLKLIRH